MSAAILPLLAAGVLLYALLRRVDLYAAFVAGAKEGLPILYRILPYMAAMLIALSLFRESGLLDWLTDAVNPLLSRLGMPGELLPLALLRPFSGAGAMAMVTELMQQYGTDSFIGLSAGIMMGSSETIFYTLALYFGSVGIKRTRYTLPVSLLAGAVSVIASIALARLWFC